MAGISTEAGWKLLLSGDKSDFTIKCQEVVFKVHQLIIKADSDFCRVICDSPFKESEEACVALEDDDPEIIARVLEYLYTGSYTEEKPPQLPGLPSLAQERLDMIATCQGAMKRWQMRSGKPIKPDQADAAEYVLTALQTHAKVYGCADKLGLVRLCNASYHTFKNVFPLAIHVLSDKEVLSILSLVYDTTPSSDTNLRYYVTTHWFCEGIVSRLEAAIAVIKQHEPLVFRVCEAWRETVAMKSDLECTAQTQRALIEGNESRSELVKAEHEAALKQRDTVVYNRAREIVELEKKLRKSERDLEEEKRYIAHVFSEMKLAKYCAYCGDGDDMMISREPNAWPRDDYTLSCLACKKYRVIERPV